MSGLIERTRAILSDHDSAPSERVHMVGVLAIALIAANIADPEREAARETVLAFWRQGMAGVA